MGKIKAIKAMISTKAGRTMLKVSHKSPELLIGAGVVGILVSGVLACKATLKVDALLEETQNTIDKIKAYKEKPTGGEYTDMDYRKDLGITYLKATGGFVKLYGPSILLGVISISCIIKSHGIMRKRNFALVAAYKAIDSSFKDYRKRVVAEFGEEKDRLLKNGITKAIVKEYDEDGNQTSAEFEDIFDVNGNSPSQYARFFDESSTQWSKTPEYNLTFLTVQQNYANDLLRTRGHVFLNDVYDLLGIERSQAGQMVGWVNDSEDNGDNFISFGIHNGYKEASRAFVNGHERSILLDFNVDGVVYDKIWEREG